MNSGAGVGGYSKSMLEMISDRLNYQSQLTLESGVTARHEVVLHPNCNAQTWGDGPMEFFAPANQSMFTDSRSFKLHGKVGMEAWDTLKNEWIPLHKKIEEALKKEDEQQQDETGDDGEVSDDLPTGSKRPASSPGSAAKRLKSDLDLVGPSVGVVNNFFSSLISSLEVKLNEHTTRMLI